MKLNTLFNGITAVAIAFAPVAGAEAKPEGTVLTTFCGENIVPAQERNREITEVCLGTVTGHNIDVVIIRSEDSRGTALPVQVLPVVNRKALKSIHRAFNTEQLLLASGETDHSSRYTILKTASALVTKSISRTSTPAVPVPSKMSGTDLNGIQYRVEKLVAMYHTQSVEIP